MFSLCQPFSVFFFSPRSWNLIFLPQSLSRLVMQFLTKSKTIPLIFIYVRLQISDSETQAPGVFLCPCKTRGEYLWLPLQRSERAAGGTRGRAAPCRGASGRPLACEEAASRLPPSRPFARACRSCRAAPRAWGALSSSEGSGQPLRASRPPQGIWDRPKPSREPLRKPQAHAVPL